jgi:2,3,4,5-tetrahydropyridine-2,6-dicarboxylate N-succinyltransferase
VNTWVKQGILLGFRFGDTIDMSADHGRWPFYDKDTLPLKKPGLDAGVRIVPGGSTIREGAYVDRSVVCMPPMFVNIGAYVGEGSLVDSHALVGSCAQVGKRVHLSAAAQIGGVIEPVGALPVIVEDDVLVGGNTGIYEGAVIKQRAVIAAGVVITGSTPIFDLARGRIVRADPGQPLIVPEGAVVVRDRGRYRGIGPRVGPVARDARDREVPRRQNRYAHGARSVDSLTQIRLTRELIDIDSTTGREADAGDFIARTLEGLGWAVTRQPVADGRFNVFAIVGKPVVVLSTHFDCVPPHFPSRLEAPGSEDPGLHETAGHDGAPGPDGAPGRDGALDLQTRGLRLYGRGACDAKGTLVAQVAAAERLRAAGETRVGLLFVVGEERGSDGAKTANQAAPGSRFLINGEPTDNRIAAATRGVYRVRLRATGRAAHSSLPERGISAIDKLVDAIVRLRDVRWPEDPVLGRTFYSIGLIGGGVAPNVISPEATAELMFRTVGGADELRRAIEAQAGHLVQTEDVLVVPPVRLQTPEKLDTVVFSFTTDIPFLGNWGTPLLIGPGSATLAHTADEYCEVSELLRAVDIYTDTARTLLAK